MIALRRLQVTDNADLRVQGAIVGFLVACMFAAVGLWILRGEENATMLFLTEGIPTLLAGLIGGWLLTPRAARASTRREWLGVVLRLGCVAVLVGAIGVGTASGIDAALRTEAEPGFFIVTLIVLSIGGGLMLATIGVVVFGWAILPVTTMAAATWALVMARLLRRAPGRAR